MIGTVRPPCAIENSGTAALALIMWNGDLASVEIYMWLIVGVVIVSIPVVIMLRMRAAAGVKESALGWMSERWLAEHRASHSAK
jgi:hypothetical protein